MRSFRRTLAVRFAGTMALGLIAASALYLSPLWSPARHVLLAHAVLILLGTGATLVGGWVLAGSALRPIREITAYATHTAAGTLDQRIVAHADTEEFSGLVAVLNQMLDRLEVAFKAQRRLVGDVGHELRTPLAALQGEIEVTLRAERSPREYQLVLRSALEEVEHLTTMSEDLLLLTRAESHLVSPRRVPTDANELLHRAVERLRRPMVEKDLTIEETLDPHAMPASLDATLVTRLVDHLLDNAVHYTPIGGRIAVSTEATSPGGVRFAIMNSGPEIAPSDLPHIFEPFYRADPARTSGDGAGLGLALVAAIARLHGGSARASNVNGNGVRFEVDLPGPALG